VLDALTHARVWGDDHQVDELRLIRMPRAVKGGMPAVTIIEVPMVRREGEQQRESK